jgi:hypothetical protein
MGETGTRNALNPLTAPALESAGLGSGPLGRVRFAEEVGDEGRVVQSSAATPIGTGAARRTEFLRVRPEADGDRERPSALEVIGATCGAAVDAGYAEGGAVSRRALLERGDVGLGYCDAAYGIDIGTLKGANCEGYPRGSW